METPEQRPLVSNGNLARRQNSKRICVTTACITSKAALLSLVWSFGVGSMYQLAYQPSNILSAYNWLPIVEEYPIFVPVIYASRAIILFFYPLSGFLADNRFGRYKTILRSLQILLVSFIFMLLFLLIFWILMIASDKKHLIRVYGSVSVVILLFFPVILGFVGFNANIIQFGMDQLFDSPADHQRLFIHWYVWIYYLTLLFTQVPWIMPEIFQYIYLYILLLVYTIALLVILALSLVLALKKKHWFNIDTARVNPYKQVYKVSKFAWQHKVPVHRSAFTYCEDELPTGLDLGKRKYGGPFTTEEVENVKAFYGILKVLFSLGPTFFLYIASDPALQWYVEHTLIIFLKMLLNRIKNIGNTHGIIQTSNHTTSR